MGFVPRLIFPVTVTINKIDTAGTASAGEYDRTAREPVKQVRRVAEAVQIRAQVQWGAKDRPEPKNTGTTHRSDGYVIFEVKDLTAKGYEPKRGDRIVSIPGVTGTWYLTSFEPCGHKNGTNHLLLANFADREPTRGV